MIAATLFAATISDSQIQGFCQFLVRASHPEENTLWRLSGTGADQNFQRDLGVMGPYEFQGPYGPMTPFALF